MDLDYRLDGPQNAPLLVLSSSLGTTWQMWEAQLPALTRHFRVLRYNTRGHGNSPLPTGALTLATLGQDVLALLDHLGVEKAHFCGISLGGLTGLWLNRYAPARFGRFVVANTAARIGEAQGWQQRAALVREQGMTPVAESAASRWFSADYCQAHPEAVNALTRALAATSPDGYAACCEALAQADLRAEVSAMMRPMLVIAGDADPVTTVRDAEAIVMDAPHAHILSLPASHLSNVACADDFTTHVITFLQAGARHESHH